MSIRHIEILVTAAVPEGQDELAHEAIVATKEGTNALVEALHKLGLTDATQTRRIYTRRVKHPAVVALAKAAE
jgi:hypothetical protein